MFLNVLTISASDVFKTLLNIIVSIECTVVLSHIIPTSKPDA